MKKELIGILFLVVLIGSVSALPILNFVGGDISDGQNITLSGNSFGAIGPTIYKWDDFEGPTHASGDDMGLGPTSENQIAWSTCKSYNPPKIELGGRAGSSQYVNCSYNETAYAGGFGMEYGFYPSPIYVSFYHSWSGSLPVGENMKWAMPVNQYGSSSRIPWYYCAPTVVCKYQNDGAGPAYSASIANQYTSDLACHTQWGKAGNATTPPSNDWIRAEFYGVESIIPNTNTGTVIYSTQSTENGAWSTILNYEGNANTRYSDIHWENTVFGFYGDQNCEVHFDDIYIADSRARVEIGDNQNFSLCNHREIQIPQQWADGSITFNVNQGSFSDGETAYVFVVDENGTASEGYPIIIGEQGSLSAPVIQSVSGNLSDGENVTIGGSGFGATGPVIEVFDDFELGTSPNLITAGAAQVGYWDEVGDNGYQQYSTDQAFSGKNSFKVIVGEDETITYSGWHPYLRTRFNSTNEYYTFFWTYVPVEDDWPGHDACLIANMLQGCGDNGVNWKQIWAHSGNNGGGCIDCDAISTLYLWGGDACFVTYGNCQTSWSPPRITGMNKGEWKLTEVYWKGGKSLDGVVFAATLQKDGIKKYSIDADEIGVTNMGACDETGYSIVDFNAWQRTTYYQSEDSWGYTRTYMDDCYLAVGKGARARVLIGNAATLTDCTNLAITTPVAWSENSITTTVRQGSFQQGEEVYLFVINADGNISEGYGPITFSGGSNETNQTIYATPHIQDYITLQEMIGSVEDYKRGLTPIEQVVANIKKFIWG